jgi:cytochrome c oxidase subunit 1
MLGIAPADIQYHDTYFVVAHFHYVLVTGSLWAIIAATLYWLPKWVGKMYNEKLAKIHFWWAMISVNVLFFPQHFLGLAGMPRRIPPTHYSLLTLTGFHRSAHLRLVCRLYSLPI